MSLPHKIKRTKEFQQKGWGVLQRQWCEFRGRPISYGQPGVPTPHVWATRKTLHQFHRVEGKIQYVDPCMVQDMVRYSASALFRSSLAAGTPASIPAYVQQINDEFR